MPSPTSRFQIVAATIVLVLLAILIGLSIRGAFDRPLSSGLAALVADPWGLATLVDLAAGLLLTATWMTVVELRPRRLWLWLPLLACLGNITTAIFLLARLRRAVTLRMWLTEKM